MMIACELCRMKSASENGYSTWPGSTGKAKFVHQFIDSILHEDDSGMPVMQDKITFWKWLLHTTVEASEWTRLCTILLNSHGKKMILTCEWCRAKSTSDKWLVHKNRKHSKDTIVQHFMNSNGTRWFWHVSGPRQNQLQTMTNLTWPGGIKHDMIVGHIRRPQHSHKNPI